PSLPSSRWSTPRQAGGRASGKNTAGAVVLGEDDYRRGPAARIAVHDHIVVGKEGHASFKSLRVI
ncbi:MAG: hypothetical protein WB537_17950, partial [Pseudolabrys sp.]